VCGNGEVEAGEGCDDGNDDEKDDSVGVSCVLRADRTARSWFEAPGTHHAPCKEFGPNVLALLTGPMEAKN